MYLNWWQRIPPLKLGVSLGERYNLNVGGRVGFDKGGMAKLVEYATNLPKNTVLTRNMVLDFVKNNKIEVNIENFFNRKAPNIKGLKIDTSFQHSDTAKKNIEKFGKVEYDKLSNEDKYRVRKGQDVGSLAPAKQQKVKFKKAYDSGYKFYKDKGIKITDKIKELVRKNISTNKGKFIPPKFSTQLIEGFTTWMPDYTLKMLKKDLRAGKNSHEIAIEYFKKNKANVLKSLEGTTYYTKPLSALSTRIGNVIREDKELFKLHNKIKKENAFIKSRSKSKYINDVETLLPIAQEQGIVPKVDWRGKPITNASEYFVHAKKVKADPISKLFGYYEKVGIEHPGGIARAIILEDPKTLNDIVATMPETNMLKGATLDKYATGQAKFYKDIGDSKYIKNLNEISKKGWEKYRKPKVVYEIVDKKVVRKPTKFSLAKPDLIADSKSFIKEYIAAGGSARDSFSKLDPNLQKAIKAYEANNPIKGNKFLKASLKSTGAEELSKKTQSLIEDLQKLNKTDKWHKFVNSLPVKLAKGIGKASVRTVGAAMPIIGPGLVAWGLSDVNKAYAAGLTKPDELAVAYNVGPEIAQMWSDYKNRERQPTLVGEEDSPEIDAFGAKDGGLSGVDHYIMNRYR
jgi:hypothetical protein